jgi:glycosyltransferase involved in cell wall biosynthesis
MVICHIWDADYPWDIRVEKVCGSLQLKHKVHLVCRNAGRLPRYEELDGTNIHRLPALPKWTGPCNAIIGFPLFFNPVWFWVIWSTVRRTRTELLLVRDLPLALPAIVIGWWFKIPALLDLAENYPAMLKDRLLYTPTSLIGRVVRHPAPAKIIEKLVLALVDRIVVVVEESRDRLLAMGVPGDRMSIVSNTPPLDRWAGEPTHRKDGHSEEAPHFVYLGNLDGSRGVDTAIKAIGLLKDRQAYARLSIIGTGPNIAQFRKLAEALEVTDRVAILGRLGFSDVQKIMAEANVGLIPHYDTEAWNSTIPNKLFDFMSMGKPVVVSEAKPTARIVREEQCGVVFKAQDAGDLADAMMRVKDSPVRDQLGGNGRASFMRKYNWAVDEQKLLESVELTAKTRGNRH